MSATCIDCGLDVLDLEACPNSPDTCIDCCPCHAEIGPWAREDQPYRPGWDCRTCGADFATEGDWFRHLPTCQSTYAGCPQCGARDLSENGARGAICDSCVASAGAPDFRAVAEALIGGAESETAGFGASIWQGKEQTSGYLVGLPGIGLEYDPDMADVAEVALWAARTERADAATWGSWQDRETGRVYFDISSHHDTLERALTVARNRGEIAVWDIAASVEVRVSA